MKDSKIKLVAGFSFLLAFMLLTAAVRWIDEQPIGPGGSSVGLAAINASVHRIFGVHLLLYLITDWLSLIPIAVMLGFAILGLVQWIKRKHIQKVDPGILILGGYYLVVFALYLLFEVVAVNYRPILISGNLEVSYPSSTTVLVLCVMPTAQMQLRYRIHSSKLIRFIWVSVPAFCAFMVIGRLVSGVHWFTDILAGTVLSVGMVALYSACCDLAVNNH